MRFFRRILGTLLIAGLLPAMLGACVVKDSPAPGCVEYWGPSMMGGCFGRSAIVDLAVEPAIDCVTIEVNNCNGGVLDVRHTCQVSLTLGGVDIPPGDSAALDVVKQEAGYALTEVYSNFSDYVPAADERIQLSGRLGEQAIQVSFTKTGLLCGD